MYRTNKLLMVVAVCAAVMAGFRAEANLLSNAGFETGSGASVPSWSQYGDARLEGWAARSGTNGLAFYGWTTEGGVYQDLVVGGISNYTLSVYGFRDNDFSILYYVQMRIEFLDADFNQLDFVQNVIRGTNQWDLHTLSAPCPPGTARIRSTLSFSGSPGSGGAFKWDDVSLTSTPYNPGTDTHYCSPTGSMVYPYTNWATASRSVASATKAANTGDTVLVADGHFNSPSQIDVLRPMLVRSVNGRASTTVSGQNLYRGFYVTAPDAVIQGLTITNCRSAMVASNNHGGAVYFVNGGTLRDCLVVNSTATGSVPNGGTGYARGGGVYCAVTGRIENCVISGNSAIGGTPSGGGLYCSGSVVVTNCDVFGNSAIGGVNFFYYGQGGAGGGLVALNGARVENSRISNNLAQAQSSMYAGTSSGAGIYCTSATVSRCLVANNRAVSGNYASRGDSGACGGGISAGNGSIVENCLILNNVATGIYVYADAWGAGLLASGTAQIRSCTIAGNRAYPGAGADWAGGGGLYATYGPTVVNTIIHGNSSGSSRGFDNWYAYSNVTMSHVCTTPGTNGAGNIAADPRLVNVAAGDAQLLADSPCIDRGDNAASPALDFAGATRPLDGDNDSVARADIGAFEAPVATTTPNLLINGTFETPSAWVFIDDSRLEPWAARNGTNGLAHYGWTDGGLVWQDVAALGTSNYTFSVWGYRDTDFPATLAVEMKLEFLSDNLTPLVVTQRFLNGSAAWTQFSITGISPPDTKVVRVVLAFSGTPGTGGAYKWDDAVLLSSEALFNARYVASGGGNISPYTNWAMAATNLQAAINVASANETILISNGIYMGETIVDRSLSIRGLGDVRLTGKSAYPVENQVRALSINPGCLLDLRNVTILNGYKNYGGGIYNQGTLVLKDCSVISNEANLIAGYGGGIYNTGTATLERCNISWNRATGSGTPGAGTGYGAGIYCTTGSVLVITDSALVGNRAYGSGNYNGRESGSGYGGGIFNNYGTITLIGSTLATNHAQGGSGGYTGGHGYGGGIYTKGLVTLRSCTLAYNRATMGSGSLGGPYAGEGGAIYLENGAPVVNVDNTLIALNYASTTGTDCRGTLNATGRNLLGSIAECAIIGETGGVIIGSDPVITAFGNYGGSTLSCLPRHGSPAIDQGSSNNVPSLDQRGIARPIDGNYDGQARHDIGACEYDPAASDSDGDSLSDAEESTVHHSNPSAMDSDSDGMGDAHEVRAGTSPTNNLSVFDLTPETTDWNGQGIVVRWTSAGGRQYSLLRATNLVNGFSVLDSGLSGNPPMNAYTDTTATASGPYFYRIRLE